MKMKRADIELPAEQQEQREEPERPEELQEELKPPWIETKAKMIRIKSGEKYRMVKGDAASSKNRWTRSPKTPEQVKEESFMKKWGSPERIKQIIADVDEILEKGSPSTFDIGTPQPSHRDIGSQARAEVEDEDVQTDENDTESELSDTEVIDGVICKYLCMAEPATGRTSIIADNEKDENGFYKLKQGMTSDSGAGDTVGPEDEFPDYPTEESPGSKRGLHYVAAGGTKIKNTGQKRVLILTKEKQLRWVTVQIAKVKKTLASVSKSNDHGFDVVYKKAGSFIENEKTKERTALRRERGVFVLDAWVIPYDMAKTGIVKFQNAKGEKQTVRVNRKNEPDFTRPAR